MTTTTPAAATTTPAAAPPALTARECAGYAADTLKAAAEIARVNSDAADSLARVADGWRVLAGDIARTRDMAPVPADDDR